MSGGARVDAVLFDLGGVLVHRPVDIQRVADVLGVAGDADEGPPGHAARAGAEERVANAVWSEARGRWDEGATAAEYYGAVARQLGLPEPDPTQLDLLLAAERSRWLDVEPVALRLLRDLQRAGVRTGILSNAPRELPGVLGMAERGDRAVPDSWATATGRMSPAIFSADVGLAKPDPAIYRLALDRLGLPPHRVAFLDDKPENVTGARSVGILGLLWQGPHSDAPVRAELFGPERR